MRIVREHVGETPERICHVLEFPEDGCSEPAEELVIALDEDFLSWFYIAPGAPLTSMSRHLLTFARDLIGPGAWAVVQIHGHEERSLFTDMGLCVVESFVNQARHPLAVNVHVTQVTTDASYS